MRLDTAIDHSEPGGPVAGASEELTPVVEWLCPMDWEAQ